MMLLDTLTKALLNVESDTSKAILKRKKIANMSTNYIMIREEWKEEVEQCHSLLSLSSSWKALSYKFSSSAECGGSST